MDSEKPINLFEIKNNRLSDCLLNTFFYQFVDNFSVLLLCKKKSGFHITFSSMLLGFGFLPEEASWIYKKLKI